MLVWGSGACWCVGMLCGYGHVWGMTEIVKGVKYGGVSR